MAYTTATLLRLDRNADGKATIVLGYTGNAAELPVEYAYPLDASVVPSTDYIRGLAMARIAILNNNLNFIAGATAAIGSVLDTTTPLPTTLVFGAYMASSAPFTPGATPQDVFTITGSATKTVRVERFGITTVQTTAGLNAWSVLRRSTANGGGTSTTVTAVPRSSSYPAATATVRQYTANPTAGNLIGAVWTGRITAPVPGSAVGAIDKGCMLFDDRSSVALIGVADGLAWNFGGVALPAGLSVQAHVWWTEG